MDEGALDDDELALAMTADIVRPERGVLPAGSANVEAPARALLQETLAGEGWDQDEPWAQLHLDLRVVADGSALRVEAVRPGRIGDWVDVERSAFATSRFTEGHWHDMVAGPASTRARYLIGYDHHDSPVAVIAVWSAGPGRPGIIEPRGVHVGHRGLGYGRSITLAGTRTLQDLGASSVMVATPLSFVRGGEHLPGGRLRAPGRGPGPASAPVTGATRPAGETRPEEPSRLICRW